MTFRRDADLDPSQVEDLRGSGRRSYGGVGGRGVAVGGGGAVGLVVLLLALVFGGGQSGGGLGGLIDQVVGSGGDSGAAGPASTALASCQTGADANAREDCRIVGYVNSIQAYWKGAFAASGEQYANARTRFFQGQIDTGCGAASKEVGPFYCPADRYVYIDLGFFDDLKSRFGATGGPFAQAYVIAHEYGHHVQDLLGAARGRRRRPGRLEPVGQDRAPGRLLRRRLGGQRGADRLPAAAHRRPDQGRPRRGAGRR